MTTPSDKSLKSTGGEEMVEKPAMNSTMAAWRGSVMLGANDTCHGKLSSSSVCWASSKLWPLVNQAMLMTITLL